MPPPPPHTHTHPSPTPSDCMKGRRPQSNPNTFAFLIRRPISECLADSRGVHGEHLAGYLEKASSGGGFDNLQWLLVYPRQSPAGR